MIDDKDNYKTFVESAEKMSDKRGNFNNIYLTFSLGLFSFISVATIDKVLFYILNGLGVLISIICFFTIDNYSKRSKLKYDIINEYETENNLKRFSEEAKRISILTNLTILEKLLPIAFLIIYIVMMFIK